MRNLLNNIFIIVFLLASKPMQLSAQSFKDGLKDTTNSITKSDSLRIFQSNPQSVIQPTTHKKKSTTLAMALSAVVPASGQFYNETYWKIPIILGLGGYWGYEWVQMNNELRTYRSKYSESLIKYPPSGNYQYKNLRDFYRSERDKFAWYLGLLYVLNIVDAYVDASLFEFNVGEDLSSVPSRRNNLLLSVKLKF
jgi:hypothetical protein